MATVDFNNPVASQSRLAVLQSIRDHVAAVSRFFDGDTLVNTQVGTVRFNTTTKLFERWGGSSWSTLDTNYARKDVGNTFSAEQTIDTSATTAYWTARALSNPGFAWWANAPAADNRRWFALMIGSNLEIRPYNDAAGSSNIAMQFTRSGIVPGTISTYGAINVGGTQSGIGRVVAEIGNSTNSGYVAFHASNGVRQGYIGWSSTTSSQDTGTIPYIAGTHSFTGNVTVSGTISGNGSGLTSINASNISSGTLADALLSSNVALRNVNNSFSASQTIGAGDTSILTVSASTSPQVRLENSGAAANNRNWLFWTTGATLQLRAFSDDYSSSTTAISFARSGTTSGNIDTYSNLIAGGLQSGIGRVGFVVGTSSNSGYVAFYDTNNNRQGYIGFTSTTGGTDTGTIPYVAALHSFTGAARTAPVSVSFSATPTFNAAQSNVFYFGTLTGNVTSMTISNPTDGQTINIRFVQDGTGGRTVTLPSGTQVSGTLNTAANAVTWLVISYVSSASRWEGTWTRIS